MQSSQANSVREVRSIWRRAQDLWHLIPLRQRWTLALAVVLMALGGAANTAIPLLLGRLVDSVRDKTTADGAVGSTALVKTVATALCSIGVAYLIRELLQLGRRVLVEDTCTRLEKHLFVRLVSHCLMTDRSAISQEKVGTLHGRMLRNVSGSVRFLRVGFLDFLPALLIGGLALARVILKNPPIVILDEATSALDTISEGRIQHWLASSRGHQTVIIVAHRLSTLLHTDRILVFDEGRIVESGTYDELVVRGGLFTELVRSAGTIESNRNI